ncbi:MarR family winged helix-turn-helix transcriptional regulator [Cellulomonas cellasea]|uniref:MarR family transcriptional regulator n=2 Tax=Cellulomonas cellasea TaxID=43670 RepID=A0A0A0B5W7_9CELL|nr:MarR family transcriptional regulator [Cellulomonas cellasea]KGM00676.1 MarR family transcriptional regulator [Cellulomonas cellasea DSM 20118]GEA87366.1 MarR family transcriptional regulator [Cellulomonas cellasea]
MSRSGADLALLLLAGFRAMADQAQTELAGRGHEDVRPVHDFALRAILTGADSASELGRAMSVTKQAAAKTIAALETRGYVAREPDPDDGRRMRLRVTEHGQALMREGEAVFAELRERWERQVGAASVAALEGTLRQLVGDDAIRIDRPGWDAADPDA